MLREEDGRTFQYKEIDVPKSIRLLRIDPAPHENDLQSCGFHDSRLDKLLDYDVLTGFWSDGTDALFQPFTVDERTALMATPLSQALLRMRVTERPRYFWIQACCIGELNTHISLLRTIIGRAGNLLVWLGDAGEESHRVFQTANKYRQISQGRAGVELFDVFTDRWVMPRGHVNGPVSTPLPLYDDATRTALRKLCQRPWWFRP